MTRPWGTALAVLLTASSLWAAPNGITLVGKGLVSGTALDKSGLNGSICQEYQPIAFRRRFSVASVPT